MKLKTVGFMLILLVVLSFDLSGYRKNQAFGCYDTGVSIVSKNNYYKVTIDFQKNRSHRKIGEAYATEILRMVPNYETIFDSYLKELAYNDNQLFSQVIVKRINDLKPQIRPEYRAELDGMASRFSGSTSNNLGDGKLSVDEVYFINLIPDIARGTQCSAFGVYGKRSVSGKTIAARILDWDSGSQNQLAQLQAVTSFKNRDKSICTIGYLGFIGVLSGLNNNGVFAGILDAGTGNQPYSSEAKYSYPLALRTALENCPTLDDVADYMKDPQRSYTYSHLIFLGNPNVCKVLENNISVGDDCIRELRTEKSLLNDGVQWGIDNAIGCVNSFLLKGNFDNHTPVVPNTTRWENLRQELGLRGNAIGTEQVKAVASFHHGNTPGESAEGDLYNIWTQQIIIYEGNSPYLQVAFRPKSGILPGVPFFERVYVDF